MPRQRINFAGDATDLLVTAFGGAAAQQPDEAPIVTLIAVSSTSAVASNVRLFYAPGAAATNDDQIEIFDQNVTIGPIAAGIKVTIIGGQGGCHNVWRDEVTGALWTLRITTTGLGGGASTDVRVAWFNTRLVT